MWAFEESNLTGYSFYILRNLIFRSLLRILLQHPAPTVGTIPRTPITPIQINTIKSIPFISKLISNPFLNFLAIVKDKVESSHIKPQIKDNNRRRIYGGLVRKMGLEPTHKMYRLLRPARLPFRHFRIFIFSFKVLRGDEILH